MKLAYSTLACPDWSWSRAVEAARAYGYHGVEWRLIDGQMVTAETPSSLLREIRAALERARLDSAALDTSLHLAHAPGPGRDVALAEAMAVLKLARELGAPWLRVFVGAFPAGASEAQAIGWTVEVLEALLPEAERLGVGIALETHSFEGRGLGVSGTSDSEVCRRVTARLPSPALGILWDIGNPYLEGELWFDTWTNVRERLAYLHLKDAVPAPGGAEGWRYVLSGEGELPVALVLRQLVSARWDGWLSFEWEKKWHPEIAAPELALPRYVEHVRGILSKLT